jgi:sterol desaturase/sphingolipid hydroxylase (fatty acid hydroxylase superfamily)
MHGLADTRVGHGLSARALTVATTPLRLLRAQPASPWFPILFYLPIALAAILWNVLAGSAWWEFIVLPAGGLLLWTLLEYVIHSVGFHWPTRSPRWLSVQASHGSHHEDPTDPMRIVAQLSTSLPVALVVFTALSLAFWDAKPAALIMVGVMIGYLAYEVVHYRIHLGWKSRWLPRALVRHHLYHHHKNQSRCYGVTTPLWDLAFRTNRLPRHRRRQATATVETKSAQ